MIDDRSPSHTHFSETRNVNPRHRRNPPVEWDLNLAPLVDVVMVLIIFFMLATKMVQREHTQVALPDSTSAELAPPRPTGSRVVINVRPAGRDDSGGPAYVIADRTLTSDELPARLAAEVRRDRDVTCYLRAEHVLPWAAIEPVLLACADAGIGRVTFATNAPQSPEP